MMNYQPKLKVLNDVQLMELIENMNRSVAGFLDCCFVYGGTDAFEMAQYYITNQEQLNEFINEYFSGDIDSIYHDINVYAEKVELENYTDNHIACIS